MNEASELANHSGYMNAVLIVVTTVFVVTPIFAGFALRQTQHRRQIAVPLFVSFSLGIVNLSVILNWFYFKNEIQVALIITLLLAQLITFIIGMGKFWGLAISGGNERSGSNDCTQDKKS